MLSFQRRHIFQVDSKCFPCPSPAAAPSPPTAMSRGTLLGLECSKPRYVSWEDAVQTDPKKKGKKKKYKNVILKERNRSVVINQDS